MAQMVKNLSSMWETGVRSLGWEDPLEKGMATQPVFLLAKFHGQRRLASYRQWCCRVKRDLTTNTHTLYLHTI